MFSGNHAVITYDRGVITAAENPDPAIRNLVLTYLETGAQDLALRARFVQEPTQTPLKEKDTWGAAHRSHETRQPFLSAVALLLSGATAPVKTATLFDMFQTNFPNMTTSRDIAVFKRRLRDQDQILHVSGGYTLVASTLIEPPITEVSNADRFVVAPEQKIPGAHKQGNKTMIEKALAAKRNAVAALLKQADELQREISVLEAATAILFPQDKPEGIRVKTEKTVRIVKKTDTGAVAFSHLTAMYAQGTMFSTGDFKALCTAKGLTYSDAYLRQILMTQCKKNVITRVKPGQYRFVAGVENGADADNAVAA